MNNWKTNEKTPKREEYVLFFGFQNRYRIILIHEDFTVTRNLSYLVEMIGDVPIYVTISEQTAHLSEPFNVEDQQEKAYRFAMDYFLTVISNLRQS